MTEFCFGDRVQWVTDDTIVGTVMDERNPRSLPHMGSFEECLPLPVLVHWDEPNETWWENGEDLELA